MSKKKTAEEKADEVKAKVQAAKAQETKVEETKVEETKTEAAPSKPVFSFPEFKGHLATVEKKLKGTYTDPKTGKTYHNGAKENIYDAELKERLRNNGFLSVVDNPAYKRHLDARSAAEVDFYKKING